ncbi:MAG: hemolysin family protein [Burkholderiales bacterium]|jgi:CBS domain containing-hemolysin-like protein|nr:hemolysin family protein [Burkholderiales bacterium]
MWQSLFLIFIAFLLVFLNGFFVAAEFSLVKLRQTRVKAIAKTYGWRGRILLKVHAHLDAYLSACQLGITLASLGLGWIGEPAFAYLLRPLFQAVGVENMGVLHGVSFFVAFFTISYLHIVVGELAPKSLAIRQSERIGVWTAFPLYAFYWLMYPAIWVLNHSSNYLLRIMGLDADALQDSQYSPEELKVILRSSRADTHATSDEWKVLAQSLDFRDLDVGDLMRPANEMVVLSARDGLEKNLEKMVEHRFSRYPYLDKEGQVEGVVHVKDVFHAIQRGEPVSFEALARPIETVSTHLPATELLRRFRQGAPHFTVVTTQKGRPLGFITMDNALGALVGEIRDEFRQSQREWTQLDDGTLIGKGSLPIFTLERALGIDIEESGVDSVGGLIMQKLGDVPEEGQKIEFDKFDAVVKKMKGPRIVMVRIYPKNTEEKAL